MDFVRLGSLGSTNYIPTMLIEGYNSLIWTERQQVPGEFELKSFDVETLIDVLPEDTLVSHLETREVMMVETHSIEMVGEGADAQPEITITGRSVTLILDHRWVESAYQKKRRMRKKYSAVGALLVLLWQSIDNASGKDVTRGDDDTETEGVVNDYDWNTLDVIPNVSVSEKVVTEGDTRWWQLEEGPLGPQFQKIMVDADLGIRTLRPVDNETATIVSIKTALAERGTIVKTPTDNVKSLRFELYSGIKRTSGDNAVKFSQLQGHLDKPRYLTSKQPYKSAIEIQTGMTGARLPIAYRTDEANAKGWDRRVGGFDAGTPEYPPEPEKPKDLGRNPTQAQKNAYHDAMDTWRTKWGRWDNKRDTINAEFKVEAAAAVKRILKQTRRVDLFMGDVSTLSPYKYKVHYDLGDTVLLVGDYGKSAEMIVAEYVRTEDAEGDRGFPGLVAP